jgi:hypothetical protein
MITKQTYCLLLPIIFLFCCQSVALSQLRAKKNGNDPVIDSLDKRTKELQFRITVLQEKRNLEYFNVRRELDHTLFLKTYEECINNEELDKAKMLVELNLERAEFRNDGMSRDFYQEYKKRIYNQIKRQRIYYQRLFEKEKTFKKNLNICLKEGTI